MIRTYFQMLLDETGHGSPGKMKQFVAWFTHGVPGGGALRQAVHSAKEGPAILASVERFFTELLSKGMPCVAVNCPAPEEELLPACGD
jgi:tRNA-dihydrouridine synthase